MDSLVGRKAQFTTLAANVGEERGRTGRGRREIPEWGRSGRGGIWLRETCFDGSERTCQMARFVQLACLLRL